jgi:hypothetical protein
MLNRRSNPRREGRNADQISTGDQEMLLFIGEGNRGPYFVKGHYPFQAVEDLDATYQGHADSILRDVLGRIESCAMEGARSRISPTKTSRRWTIRPGSFRASRFPYRSPSCP